jgi:aerobic-type carbon monoxide dehydrogenase small subunit (CoxS/CutS family)
MTGIGEVEGGHVRTIESLSNGERLHPVQDAFISEAASQCGYCTSGMIMSLTGFLEEHPHPTDADVMTRMEGNLCRCCNYLRIKNAIRRAVANSGR